MTKYNRYLWNKTPTFLFEASFFMFYTYALKFDAAAWFNITVEAAYVITDKGNR
jgi:hypothetical protein